jgi:hypothetical protein
MSAKHKLNAAYFSGAVLVASVAGAVTGSWGVFGVALIALLIAAFCAGEIRR